MESAQFPGVAAPAQSFEATRAGLRAQLFYVDVDLSAARTAANPLRLPIAGNVLYVDQKASGGVARVHFQDQGPQSTPITVFPGFVARLQFTQIAIENEAQAGVTMRLIYGTDVNFDPGTGAGMTLLNPVSVIDGAAAITKAEHGFYGFTSNNAFAGNYTYLQLYNPAGSGVNAFIKRILPYSASAGVFQMRVAFYATPIASLDTYGVNKKAGGALSKCALRYDNNAAVWGTPFCTLPLAGGIAFTGAALTLEQPLELTPGTGLIVFPLTVNTSMLSSFDFYEESA